MKRALVGAVLAVALAGCSGSDGESDPRPIRGSPKQVADLIARLEATTRRGDYEAICDELLAAAARERAGGDDCASLLRSTGEGVRDPRIRLLSIRVEGERAEVRVRSTAVGQAAVDETIDLVSEEGEYRIASLSR